VLGSSLGSSLTFTRDDSNESTSRSLGRSAYVADLDEMLATPAPALVSPPPLPRTASAFRSEPRGPELRGELLPEAPTRIELGPSEHSSRDLDFGFDVSEQRVVSSTDLLEQSFSSLLDVSESQMLGEATPDVSSPWSDSKASRASAVEPAGGADFDVSSSDLATATATLVVPLVAPPVAPQTESRSTTTAVSQDLDFFAGPAANPHPGHERVPAELPPPIPASAYAAPAAPETARETGVAASASSAAAVAHMSPILQQQVQETLEKVAWEAFSDLSETIVKQVIERVERIAWEVIPQMAETLVREEIRKMKGEND
jgi:hypothetical protein